MSVLITALSQTVESAIAPAKALTDLPKVAAQNPVKTISQAAGAVTSALALPTQLINTGLASLTAPIAAMLPSFPAATLGSLYVGAPHAHAHPPSLIPPAPPIPLPSIGSVTLGTSVQVLIGGMPAARAGDLGLAPTCGGLAPFFTISLGSSSVFIGGTRAARMTDFCTACTMSTTPAVRSLAAALRASATASMAVGLAGIASSLVDAASGGDDTAPASQAAVAAASGLNAAMSAAQMAADLAATVIQALMGSDPAIPPALPGAIMMGTPNVLIGGMPLPNTPDVSKILLGKIKGRLAKRKAAKAKKKAEEEAGEAPGGGCGCAK
jgi:uncharacterized Zn-binding protein involved in type VI secretion